MADGRIDPAAEAFGVAATDYERARPSYPPEAMQLLAREMGLAPGITVCDLAAGTGKLTRLLVDTGATVVAVEPVAGMRAELAEAVPGIQILDGTAEAIPIDDGELDAVTVAQAFHWFRVEEALAEIRRVLRPHGTLAILFNERDERSPWVKTWNEAIEWHSRRIAKYQDTDWSGLMQANGFGNARYRAVDWLQPMTRELIASRVRSVSYIAELGESEQQDYVDRVLALVSDFVEPFDLPYIAHVWLATRA